MVQVSNPHEVFPQIATVANPAVFFDGEDALLCYETSDRAGSSNVVLKFGDVIDLRITPMNVEGLSACRYPIKPWAFNEIVGGEETARWKALNPRLWLISFHDLTIEVIFGSVSFLSREPAHQSPHKTLLDFAASLRHSADAALNTAN
ncbi:hypothetical protein ACCC98_31295 [Rhizobium pisi]|uniref:hypothetical protein n=1 Tax=Rhizobium pisi TaxID=574561 RepID=UPI0039B11DE2